MIRGAKDDCLEFDAAAFAREAEKIAATGRHVPNEVGHPHFSMLSLMLCQYRGPLPSQIHQIVRRQGAGPCVPSDVSGFAPFAMLAFLVAATSGSVNLLNAANGTRSHSRQGRRRRRRDLLGMLWPL